MSHPQQVLESAGLMEQMGSSFKLVVDGEIDAVPHPGHVGDGSQLDFCRTCKGVENLSSCVVCDFCDDLHHTACVRVDPERILQTWMCKSCRWMRGISPAPATDHPGFESNSDAEVMEIDDEDGDGEAVLHKHRKLKMDMKRPRAPVRVGPQYQHSVPPWQGRQTTTANSAITQNDVPLTGEEIRKDLKRVEAETRKLWLKDAVEDGNTSEEDSGATWLKQRAAPQG